MSLLSRENVPVPVLEVVQGLKEGGHQAFLVGGCVRDLLRGHQPKDFDVATSALPEQVTPLFRRVIPTGVEHGTVTVVQRGVHVEVTTFRAESDYVDGRRPSKVEFHQEIEADLSRRDFTINAMAWDPAGPGAPVDPFGGQADLERKLVRCVRSALERFSEDGLRALRAVRFATVLDFALDPDTRDAIPRTLSVFRKVAGERMQQELVKLLLAPEAPRGLTLLRDTGLLAEFFPEALGADFAAVGRTRPDVALRLAILCLGAAAPREVVLRLKFPGKVAEETGALVSFHALPATASTDAALRRWAARVDRARVPVLFELAAALRALPDAELAQLRTRVEALLASRPPLTARELALDGKAIMNALGVGPSPAIGHATRHLLDLVLDDPGRNTPESLTVALKGWNPPE